MGAGDFSPTTVRRACRVSGCERSAVGRGLCDMHYRRARRGGDTGSPSPRSFPRTCTLDGCDGKHYALGLCKKHHQRRWRHGTVEIIGRRYEKRPLADRVRELTPTEATDRGCLEWLGHRDRDGYGRLWFDDSSKPATRAVWIAHHGPIPDGLIVRHICDNPPCVNIAHLLLGAHADNARDKVPGSCRAPSSSRGSTRSRAAARPRPSPRSSGR